MSNRHISVFFILILIFNICIAEEFALVSSDIDGDGIVDFVVETQNIIDAKLISINITIDYSSGAESAHFTTPFTELRIYHWPGREGLLIFDYSFYFSYSEIYKWNLTHKKLCRYLSEKESPLAGDADNVEKFVAIYNGCLGIETSGSGPSSNDYYKKNNIIATISEKKAILFNSTSLDDQSKMYLVRRDKVLIKEYRRDKIDWFLVEYKAKNRTEPIIKWIVSRSIEPLGN